MHLEHVEPLESSAPAPPAAPRWGGADRAGEPRGRVWWRKPAGGADVWRIALPLVVSQLSWTLMQFIDRMFLAWHSEQALAAALPSAVVWWLLISFPLGLCAYATTFVAQYHGAGRHDHVAVVVWQAAWLAIAFAPLGLLGIPLAPLTFAWAGHAPDVASLEAVYFQVLCWGAPLILLGESFSTYFTGQGRTRTLMVVNIAMAAVNVVLDYLWIFGKGGFPALGIAGAAWATVAAFGFRALILCGLFLAPRAQRQHATWSSCRWDAAAMRRLLKFGFPSGMQMCVELMGFTVFMVLLGRLGARELAASNLAFNVSMLAFMPVFGLSMTATALVGQHLGENRDDLAATAAWSTFQMGVGYMGVISLLFVVVPTWFVEPQLPLDALGRDELRRTAIVLLRFVAAYNIFDAMTMIFVGAIKGAGDTRFVFYCSLVMALVLTAGCWVILEVAQGGLLETWTFLTVWMFGLGSTYALRFRHGRWRQMRVIEPPDAA